MSITDSSKKTKLRQDLYKPATKDIDPIRYQQEENQWGLVLNNKTLGAGSDASTLGIDAKMDLIADMFDEVEGHVVSENTRLDGKIDSNIVSLRLELKGGASADYDSLGELEGHIKANDSDILNLENTKIDKASISNSTTSGSTTNVSSSLATKTAMDRADSAYNLADTKVARSGDTWTGTHNLTDAELYWNRDSDYAKIYLKDEGANAERLAISFGDDAGTDHLIFEWKGSEKLAEFHQNKFLFHKDIYEKGTKLETKYAFANGSQSRDFSIRDAFIYGGDITFKDGSTSIGAITNYDGTFTHDTLVGGKVHQFKHQGVDKLIIAESYTNVRNNLVVDGVATFENNIEVRSDGAAPHIDFSNDATTDYDARIILTGNDTLDVQGVALDNFKVRGHRVLTTERMGHGSDISACDVDGIQGSQIVVNDANNIMNGDQAINGSITLRDEFIMKSQTDTNNTQLGQFTYEHNDAIVDGIAHSSKFYFRHKANSGATATNDSVVIAKGFDGQTIFEGGQKLANRYLGLHAKADDAEKLDGRDSTQYQQIDKVTSGLSEVGWYTIARGSSRASAKFCVADDVSGRHGKATFYAAISYGDGAHITVLESGGHGGGNGIFDKLRIVSDPGDGTYGSVELQVFVDTIGSISAYIMEDLSPHHGWTLIDFESPNATLTVTEAEVELDHTHGLITSSTIYSNGNQRVYDTSNPPVKAEVGLSNVPNYPATSSLTDGSTSKFATAKATKDLEDKKIDRTQFFNDTAYTNPMTATHVVGGLVGQNFLTRILQAESEIDDLWVLMNEASNNGTFDSLKELLDYMNANSGDIEHANTKVEATISNTQNAQGQYHVLNLGGYLPEQWMRSDVDDVFNANMTLANGKKLYVGDTGRYIAQNGSGMKIYTDDDLIISGMHDTTLNFDSNKITSSEDLYVNDKMVFYQGNITKSDVGLSNLPNAKSDVTNSANSNVLATSKAVKSVQDYANSNRSQIQSNDTDIAKINADMGIGTYTHDDFVKKDEDSVISANVKVTGNILADKIVAGDGNALYVPYPKGAKLISSGANTGAVKIKLPVSWNDSIVNMNVNLRTSNPSKNISMKVGGFLSTQANAWVQGFAQIFADEKQGDYDVKLGHDGVNACIIISNTTDSWNDIQVNVTGLEAGYVTPGNTDITRYVWDDDWSITLISAMTGITVNQTLTDNLTASDWHKIDNLPSWMTQFTTKAADTDKFDGLDSTQFLRSDVSDTMYGNLTFKGSGNAIQYRSTDYDKVVDVIKFHDGGEWGSAVSINGGARTVISSGEAAHANLNNIASAGSETMGVASDQNIVFHTALQGGWGARQSWEMTNTGDFKAYHGEIYAQDGTKRVYHQGFQGIGSGLDAETVGTKQLSQLIQTDVASQTIDGGQNTNLTIKSNDNGLSSLYLHGDSQGTGRIFVGQASSYGGGIEYNGDNAPSTTGAGSDFTTLYRVANGTYSWTAKNHVNSNDWEFRGNVKAPTVTVAGWTMDIVEV